MEKKYWVPALEKANAILLLIAEQPGSMRLIDLSKSLNINKSSMFSLLHTLEKLEWAVREEDGAYSLGSALAYFGTAYFKQFQLIEQFHKEASGTKQILKETIQLAALEGRDVIYLAKEESPSQVKLASDPGKKLPAHATALGKVLLAALDDESLLALYAEEELFPKLTPYTLPTRSALLDQLDEVRQNGFALDDQEAVVGFNCLAAPIKDAKGRTVAAISCSMLLHEWRIKREIVEREMLELADRLSNRQGD